MQINASEQSTAKNRLGIHYFPDTLHYREGDLSTWLPELVALGVGWVVLRSEAERAIPESFLRGLLSAGITPIVHFSLPLASPVSPDQMRTLLSAYARWGVKYVVFFDRPNARKSWPASAWAQQDLVERFLDRWIPLAALAIELQLVPVFPPLEPGGDFWDTAFLWTALQSLERRRQQRIIDKLVLSAYAWTGHHSLNWGLGGPQRWPEVRPYYTPPGDQDQRGFRIYEWYQDVSRAVLQKQCPIIMLQAGATSDPDKTPERLSSDDSQVFSQIARLLQGETVVEAANPDEPLEPIGPEVLACNFWLLAADPGSKYAAHAWYPVKDRPKAVVERIKEAAVSRRRSGKSLPGLDDGALAGNSHLIEHYLLLPVYSWGTADWQWNVIQPFVRKHRPTVGFSLQEAALAAEVTVVGDEDAYSEEDLNWLRQLGCRVERVSGDGTKIATSLGER